MDLLQPLPAGDLSAVLFVVLFYPASLTLSVHSSRAIGMAPHPTIRSRGLSLRYSWLAAPRRLSLSFYGELPVHARLASFCCPPPAIPRLRPRAPFPARTTQHPGALGPVDLSRLQHCLSQTRRISALCCISMPRHNGHGSRSQRPIALRCSWDFAAVGAGRPLFLQ